MKYRLASHKVTRTPNIVLTLYYNSANNVVHFFEQNTAILPTTLYYNNMRTI